MTARVLDGKSLAESLCRDTAAEVARFHAASGVTPCLAAVLVGDDPASQVYVRNKRRACAAAGMTSRLHRLPADASENQLLTLIAELNNDPAVHGVLTQLPLPAGIATSRVLDAVRCDKDVDAFHPTNVGLLCQGRPRFLPCTPHGVLQLLARSELSVAGKEVVVVGRSDIVGKPLAMLLGLKDSPLGARACNATVTLCHSHTRNLTEITRRAEVLVAAVGKLRFITGDMVRPGAVVIDVGIHRGETGLVGDVDFASVKEVASHLTPVPGGVGPLTIAMLLHNTLAAARLQQDSR